MTRQNAILIFSSEPCISRANGKEPYAALPWDDIDALFAACLCDVFDAAADTPDTDVFFYRKAGEPLDERLMRLRSRVTFCEVQGDLLSTQVEWALGEVFNRQYHNVLVVLDNSPTFTPRFFERTFAQLSYDDDCVVVGPTTEGIFSFIAMKSNHADIFNVTDGDPLTKPGVLLERLCAADCVMFPTATGYLLNSGTNLARLRKDVEAIDVRVEKFFPRRTADVFKKFDKKYKSKPLPR